MVRIAWISGITLESLDRATWIETCDNLSLNNFSTTLFIRKKKGNRCDAIKETTNMNFKIVEIDYNTKKFIGFLGFPIKAIKYVLKNYANYDVIYFQERMVIFVFFLDLIYHIDRGKVKYVCDTRTIPMITKKGLRKIYKNIWWRMSYYIAGKFCDGITAITEELANFAYPNIEKEIGIWGSGVNLYKFSPQNFKFRMKRPCNNIIKFIYIGAITTERDLESFIKAVSKFPHKAIFNIYGFAENSSYSSELENFIITNEIKNVFIQKPVPHNMVPEILSTHHVGVIPFPNDFIFSVSSPIKLFEYIAMGMIIVAPTGKYLDNYLLNYPLSFRFSQSAGSNLGDVIKKILTTHDIVNKIPYINDAILENISWSSQSTKLITYLDKLLK